MLDIAALRDSWDDVCGWYEWTYPSDLHHAIPELLNCYCGGRSEQQQRIQGTEKKFIAATEAYIAVVDEFGVDEAGESYDVMWRACAELKAARGE